MAPNHPPDADHCSPVSPRGSSVAPEKHNQTEAERRNSKKIASEGVAEDTDDEPSDGD